MLRVVQLEYQLSVITVFSMERDNILFVDCDFLRMQQLVSFHIKLLRDLDIRF